MAAQPSPQLEAVGETNPNQMISTTYATLLNPKQSAQGSTKTSLKLVEFVHGEPTITFSMEERQAFVIEEGLHQAVVLKLSYGAPDLKALRSILPKQLGTKGNCIIGLLAPRQLLLRFDQYEDYVLALSRSVNYLLYNGKEHQYRVFPWSIGYNPKEETTKAVVWISLSDLSPELFAKKSLLSIASAVGKPIAIDKATQIKSRPSTARVKVILDIMDKLPNRIRLQFVDGKSGKLVDVFQEIVYDNLPLYCNYCKHQGHDENSCRLILKRNQNSKQVEDTSDVAGDIEKYQGDARAILNEKRRITGADQSDANALGDRQILAFNSKQNLVAADIGQQKSTIAGVVNASIADVGQQAVVCAAGENSEATAAVASELVAQNADLSGQQLIFGNKNATAAARKEKGINNIAENNSTDQENVDADIDTNKGKSVEQNESAAAATGDQVLVSAGKILQQKQIDVAGASGEELILTNSIDGKGIEMPTIEGEIGQQIFACASAVRNQALAPNGEILQQQQILDSARVGANQVVDIVDEVEKTRQPTAANGVHLKPNQPGIVSQKYNDTISAQVQNSNSDDNGNDDWTVVTKRKSGRIKIGSPSNRGTSAACLDDARDKQSFDKLHEDMEVGVRDNNKLVVIANDTSALSHSVSIANEQLKFTGVQILETLNPIHAVNDEWLSKFGHLNRKMQLPENPMQLSNLGDNWSGNQKSLVPVEHPPQAAGGQEYSVQQVGINTSVQEIPSQDQDLLLEDNDTQSLFSSATKNKKWADLIEAEDEQENDNMGDHDTGENSTAMVVNKEKSGQHKVDTNEGASSKQKGCSNQKVQVLDEQDEEEFNVQEREDGENLLIGRKNLSPNAPIFIPSKYSMGKHDSNAAPIGQQKLISTGAKINVANRRSNSQKINQTDRELLDALVNSNSLAPINTSKHGGTSTFSLKSFRGAEIFEEGEEDDILDECYKNAAREAGISPRHQRSGNSKNKNKTHGRNCSWGDKESEQFIPRQLPMRQAKQKVTIPTTSTKSNRSKKN